MLTVKKEFSLKVFLLSLNKEILRSMVPMMGMKELAEKEGSLHEAIEGIVVGFKFFLFPIVEMVAGAVND